MNLKFWRKEELTWKNFWGMEDRHGRQILGDVLDEAGVCPEKKQEVLDFVETILRVKVRDVLKEIEKYELTS